MKIVVAVQIVVIALFTTLAAWSPAGMPWFVRLMMVIGVFELGILLGRYTVKDRPRNRFLLTPSDDPHKIEGHNDAEDREVVLTAARAR